MERQAPSVEADRARVRAFEVSLLGLVVGVSRRGVTVRRRESEWRVPQQNASDWARYCGEVRRR